MKLTAAIAMSYPNAEIFREEHTYPPMFGLDIKINTINLQYKDAGSCGDYTITECQLILTPLDKISDEDAVEVCKFLYSNPALHNPERGKSVATVGDWHSTRKGVEVIDYLRSKGYDCGHGSIPSLIAAGVAVEKEIV